MGSSKKEKYKRKLFSYYQVDMQMFVGETRETLGYLIDDQIAEVFSFSLYFWGSIATTTATIKMGCTYNQNRNNDSQNADFPHNLKQNVRKETSILEIIRIAFSSHEESVLV